MSSKASILALIDSTRMQLGFARDQSFMPTANVRNPHMLEEAEAFSIQLKDFQRAVGDYHRNIQRFLRGLMPLLESNLPRVWTAVPETAGLAEPVRASISHGHPSRVGGDYDGAAVVAHMDILERSIEQEILAPLRRWQDGLQVARERMKSLDKLRREVDGQRKKYEKKFRRSEQRLRRAYLGAGFGGSSSSSSSEGDDVVPRGKLLEDYQRLALHTERQLRAIVESYEDQERLVWEQLSGLVTDAAWLESYAAATMIKVKEVMQGVAVALGPSKQPLPAYRPRPGASAGGEVQYGEVGANMELIKQMSPRALELASGALPRGATVLPYQPLRAKRGTATPLLVAAAAASGSEQRQLAAEPVPPVQLGASGVPMELVPRDVADRAIRDVERRAAGEGIHVREIPTPAFLSSSSPATAAAPAGAQPGAATGYPALQPPPAAAAGGGRGGSSMDVSSIRDQGFEAREGGMAPGGFREGGLAPGGFGEGQMASGGFREGGRDTLGFRETGRDRDDLGFRERDIEGAGYRHQGLSEGAREPSLAYGIRDTAAAPAAAAAAAATGPMEGEVISESGGASGPETPMPFSRVYGADGQGQGLRPESIRPMGAATAADAEGPAAAAAVSGEGRGYERGYERPAVVGPRCDDILDSYATPLKMTAAETAGISTGTPPSPGPRNITDAIKTEIAQASPNNITNNNQNNNTLGMASAVANTDTAVTSPAYPSAARAAATAGAGAAGAGVGGMMGSAGGFGATGSESEGEFQDARSEAYPSRGISAGGYETAPINTAAVNGGRAAGAVADAPYSPGAAGAMSKQQQQQMFERPVNVRG